MNASLSEDFWEITPERVEEYVARGHKRRRFFPHRAYHLPKCGPDGFRLAQRMCETDDPGAMWQVLLYAGDEIVAAYPPDLFFDDDLMWHRQQFGRPGQVATANIVLDGDTVHSTAHHADPVQRISRRREHNTKVSKHFRGWSHMLLNAIVAFAHVHGARRVRTPTSGLAMRNTDSKRRDGLGSALFERVYDRTVADLFEARRDGQWWEIDVAGAQGRMLMPRRRRETRPKQKTICICHDVERGLGYAGDDPAFARRADETSAADLARIAAIEAELGMQATYCVVGTLMDEVRETIGANGHCIAFHSFDHRLEREDQLPRCRDLDYRIKGYRPPGSVITSELTDANLLFHNFEWLAASRRPLRAASPTMRSGIVRLPVSLDDHPLHTGQWRYEQWEERALSMIALRDFVVISLHDCYASLWLDHYRDFLAKVSELGALRTLDDVAAEVTLCSAW